MTETRTRRSDDESSPPSQNSDRVDGTGSNGGPESNDANGADDAADRGEAVGPNDPPTLSVVVIARNEESQIGRCLSSVLSAVEPFDSEVVLVDSNSTDGTVERASEFPVSVLRIPTDDLTTPAAGRYVGTEFAKGEQILFVDGDVVLESGWLGVASGLLVGNEDIAGVGGYLGERTETSVVESEWLAGVALYDADALARVGGFDPYLGALEDLHLGHELTEAGYRLVRLPTVVGEQVRDSTRYLEPIRRWRRGYFHGGYDALFRSTDSPRIFAKHLYELRHPLATALWLGLGTASVVSLPLFGLWLAASLAGVVVLVGLTGPRRAFHLVSMWSTHVVALLDHEWREPPPREAYPLDRIERLQVDGRLASTESAGFADGEMESESESARTEPSGG